jgi:hypothetical protein
VAAGSHFKTVFKVLTKELISQRASLRETLKEKRAQAQENRERAQAEVRLRRLHQANGLPVTTRLSQQAVLPESDSPVVEDWTELLPKSEQAEAERLRQIDIDGARQKAEVRSQQATLEAASANPAKSSSTRRNVDSKSRSNPWKGKFFKAVEREVGAARAAGVAGAPRTTVRSSNRFVPR